MIRPAFFWRARMSRVAVVTGAGSGIGRAAALALVDGCAVALAGRAHNIACGQIEIGNAATALTAQLQADEWCKMEPTIDVRHLAEAVLYRARLPLEANVLSITVTATHMPFVGGG